MTTATLDTTFSPIHDALRLLAERCDGAQSRDDAGFNKPDSYAAKRLAALDTLDEITARQGWEMLRTYTRQLAAAGITYADLPVPPALATPPTHRIGVQTGTGAFLVTFPCDAQDRRGKSAGMPLGAAIRALAGRQWDGIGKRWVVAPSQANALALLDIAGEYDLHLSGVARARIDELQQATAPEPQTPVVQSAGRKITVEGAEFLVRFPYDAALVDSIKRELKSPRWDAVQKVWRLATSQNALEKVQGWASAHKFDVSGLQGFAQAQERAAEAAQAAKLAADQQAVARLTRLRLAEPLADGNPLRPFQRVGVERLLLQGRAILADDRGLGKSRQALMAAKAYYQEGVRVLVLSPISVKEAWLREAAICEVPIEVHSHAKIPAPLEAIPYVLIADEAHAFQNLLAKRTKKFLALADKAQAVWCLSGTPIKNGRPSNLFPLLKACRHRVADDKSEYERRYCAAKPTKWSRWDVTGASHLDELHSRIKDILILRTKKEVAKELPKKTRILSEVELPAEAKAEYFATIDRLKADYQARRQSGEIKSGGEALVALTHARHAGDLAKAEHAVEITMELLEQGDQVILFAETLDTLAKCQTLLAQEEVTDTVTLTGATPQADRQGMVDQFQAGTARVFLATIKAGGVGLTLTGPEGVSVSPILIGRPYTSGDAEQAEDRAHRIGQDKPVICHWLQMPSRVDEGVDLAIDALLEQKYQRIELILKGKRASMQGIGSIEEVALALADRLFKA